MAREIRPPEWVLEELYKTARGWMAARAKERAHGPSSYWGKGDNPRTYMEPKEQDQAVDEANQLRGRFEHLVGEFIDRVEDL